MDIFSKVDTTTFVLVTLLLFLCYNVAVFCWFKFIYKEGSRSPGNGELKGKFSENPDGKETTDELDDLPF